ncbi:MAG: hypothetical protein WC819_00250 [Parcubacteria group bacterium]|jgi:hypothetical protein
MKKYLLIAFIILFIIVGYFSYTIFTKRESDLIKNGDPSAQDAQKSTIEEDTNTQQENIVGNPSDEENSEEITNSATEENANIYIHVTPLDCERECEPYQYDEKELKYCQNVCGLSDDTISDSSDCNSLKDLTKDYCLKDQAISKKDISICDSISDTNVKKTCKSRIQEDILEGM